MGIKQHIPNIISISRGIVALVLLLVTYGSPLFWIAYIWCGISDMIDGALARKLNATSKLGATIDSITDLIFVVIAASVFLPRMDISMWMWLFIGVIAFVKIVNAISGYVMFRKVIMLHTIANKLTGLLLFLLPIAVCLLKISISYAAPVVIAVALFASVQEGHFIRTGRIDNN